MKPNSGREPQEKLDDPQTSETLQREIRELLEMLPADVVSELNAGTIDVNDPAFLGGLTDHVSRQALADPHHGRRLLGKLGKVKTLIRRMLHDSDESLITSNTIRRADRRTGRNDPCPCGSGRKFKECCLRKQAGA